MNPYFKRMLFIDVIIWAKKRGKNDGCSNIIEILAFSMYMAMPTHLGKKLDLDHTVTTLNFTFLTLLKYCCYLYDDLD